MDQISVVLQGSAVSQGYQCSIVKNKGDAFGSLASLGGKTVQACVSHTGMVTIGSTSVEFGEICSGPGILVGINQQGFYCSGLLGASKLGVCCSLHARGVEMDPGNC